MNMQRPLDIPREDCTHTRSLDGETLLIATEVLTIISQDHDHTVLAKLLRSGLLATLSQQSQTEQETGPQTGLPG